MLGNLDIDQFKAIFMAGARSALAEKRAGFLDDIGKLGKGTLDSAKTLALLGAGSGALSSAAYHVIKDSLMDPDPKDKLNRKIEARIKARKMEHEDSKWMEDIRRRRNRLIREWKGMSTQEYAKEYGELVKKLDEKRK